MKPTILIVEDNTSDTFLIKKQIMKTCLDVDILNVESLSDSYEILKDTPIDHLLLDLNLPDAFGTNTVQTIRNFAPKLNITVLTESNDRTTIDRVKKAGANHVFLKNDMSNINFKSLFEQNPYK